MKRPKGATTADLLMSLMFDMEPRALRESALKLCDSEGAIPTAILIAWMLGDDRFAPKAVPMLSVAFGRIDFPRNVACRDVLGDLLDYTIRLAAKRLLLHAYVTGDEWRGLCIPEVAVELIDYREDYKSAAVQVEPIAGASGSRPNVRITAWIDKDWLAKVLVNDMAVVDQKVVTWAKRLADKEFEATVVVRENADRFSLGVKRCIIEKNGAGCRIRDVEQTLNS